MTTALVLVGWDDAKSRPIYQRQNAGASSKKEKKSKVKFNKSGGGRAKNCQSLTDTMSALDDDVAGLSSLDSAATGKHGRLRTEKSISKRRKVRTISLSPDQGAGKKEVRWDGAAPSVIAYENELPAIAMEEEAITNARESVSFGAVSTAGTSKRRRGYGTKSSTSSNANSSSLSTWGGYDDRDHFASSHTNDKAMESSTNAQNSPPLKEDSVEEKEEEFSDASTSINDDSDSIGSDASIQSGSSCINYEMEKASQPSEERDVDSDVSDHGASPYSPNSNFLSFESYQHKEESIQKSEQSPMEGSVLDLSEDESINSGYSKKQEVPIAKSIYTRSTFQSQPSLASIDTPKSGNDPAFPAFDPTTDTPLGEDSTTTPNIYERRDDTTNEFADFDVTFDKAESHPQPNQKRRSYGDVKPVWISSKHAANTDGASAEAAKIIGWDDVKGRPIFHAPTTRNGQIRDIPSNSLSMATNENAEPPVSSSEPNNDDDGSQLIKRAQKKRVYASLFKKQGLSQSARDRMDIDSPSNACSPNAISAVGQVSRVNTSIEGMSEEDANDKTKVADSDHQRNALFDVDLEMEAIMNDSNTHRPQPTSKSSLESARAFFRYLDSNHNFTILGQNEPTREAKAGVIRTKRKIEHCEQLQWEYSQYCKTVLDTGVQPISLNDFAKHWNRFFTEKGIVRDGLLDED